MSRALLVLGCGYSARRFLDRHGGGFARVDATMRAPDGAPPAGITRHAFDGITAAPTLRAAARQATHVIASIPPGERSDPGLDALAGDLAAAPALTWIGYLSTTAVYGDRGGATVDETAVPTPQSPRARRRLAAEEAWRRFGSAHGAAVQIFRLSGIYGPGRNALVDLARGTARRIDKPGHAFNRIHVDDIADALMAGITRPAAGPVLVLADDAPAPSHEVVRFAAELLGIPPPPLVPYDEAQLSDMARSFWTENKRIDNAGTKRALGLVLHYPDFRAGLRALHADGEGGGGETLAGRPR
jgi:dTDP-4-dehydrorhamnose reductase